MEALPTHDIEPRKLVDTELKTICCYCGKLIRVTLTKLPEGTPAISHGICDKDLEIELNKI